MISAHPLRNMKSAFVLASVLLAAWPIQNAVSATSIADLPVFATNSVPPNMMLALSVEWPTGVVAAYKTVGATYNATTFDDKYVDNATTRYVGYFDPRFCYTYYQENGKTANNKPSAPLTGTPQRTAASAAGEYFRPVALATTSGDTTHRCDGNSFSGNFLNWATTHALDAFRFTLTGGDRVIDTASLTVVEKTRHTGQGGYGQFPIKDGSVAKNYVSPFPGWSKLYVRLHNGSGAAGGAGRDTNKYPNVDCPKIDRNDGNGLVDNYSCTNGELNSFNDASTRGRMMEVSNNSSFNNSGADITYTYLVRVQVCDKDNANAALRFEYNTPGDFNSCQGYPVGSSSPTVYKPVGLIQKNATQMRFGATGYLADDSPARSGGVLRARLKSIGPDLAVANGSPIANANKEWDAATGVYIDNPDTADATASGVSNSGVINYLNRFGKRTEGPYKSYDTLSELYYSILRSIRNMKAVPEYVSNVDAAMTDGFPVISTAVTEPSAPFTTTNLAPLPIQYYCQQTNIVGIADANVQCDNNVPGNTLATCGSPHGSHAKGTGITDDVADLNVTTLGNKLGSLEFNTSASPLNTSLGSTWLGSDKKTTYHVASLAYWANTKDMLPDDANKPWTVAPSGSPASANKQQAKTYFVDVRENPSYGPNNNQMWLAAKYGGFDDINNDGKPSSVSTWHTNSDVDTTAKDTKPSAANNGYRPDNYFFGNTPDKLFSSLSAIFNNVLSRKLSGQGTTLSTNDFQSSSANSGAYTVAFNAPEWTGDVKGYQISMTGTTPTTTLMWSAQAKLDDQISNGGANNGWDSRRKIVTYDASASPKVGVPFRWANLNSTQKAHLQNTSSMLDYLRGKNCHEVGNTTTNGCTDSPKHQALYRTRANMLGDIVDSEATVVDVPSGKYVAASGYPAFVTKYKTTTPRKRMLYVGANDGMMHAIDGDVGAPATTTPPAAKVDPGATAGQELWAFVPNMVFAGPTLPTPTPTVNGLAARTLATGFSHKYYVNQTPVAVDIDIDDTRGVTTDSCANRATTGCSWRTILVGGLGKGGRGYYAIDVTNPADWTSESEVAKKVMWEFTDSDMGFSFGLPLIVRTERDGWVVILSSGYDNTFGDAANKGKGFLYILNARTGELIQKISTGDGSESDPSGFAHPGAYIPDSTTYITDYVYGGDLHGNVWRFDLRGTPTAYPAPTKIAKLTTDGSDGTADATVVQPVTTQPIVGISTNGVTRWVFVGTGRLLALDDMTDTQQQTLYAFREGTLSAVYGSDAGQRSLPSGVTFPLTRSTLVNHTSLLSKVVTDTTHQMGWYHDLKGTGERITQPLVPNEGLISWTGLISSTDACSPGARSRVYVTDYDYGLTRLRDTSGVAISYYDSPEYLTKTTFTRDSTGGIGAGTSNGDTTADPHTPLEGKFGPASGNPVRVNWREIQQ